MRIVSSMLTVLFAVALNAYANPAEMAEMRAFVKTMTGQTLSPEFQGSLEVLSNHYMIWKNGRLDKPLVIGGAEFRRGFYCHAPSDILVTLPGPGAAFSACIGVDTNNQTRGGNGSVVFSVEKDGAALFTSGVMREGMACVPVRVALDGASSLHLKVGDSGDGISCDQADWADAKVTLADGKVVWLGGLPVKGARETAEYADAPSFSFLYDGKPFAELMAQFDISSKNDVSLDDARVQHNRVYTDRNSGLEVRWEAVEYQDFPVIEWTVYFANKGNADTPILSEIRALDVTLHRLEDNVYQPFNRTGEFALHHYTGSICAPNDYEPHTTALPPNAEQRFAAAGGRGSNGTFPYFNIEWPGEGVIAAVGWPGQWDATFTRDGATGLRVTAGQEQTHFTLHPGEEARTPLTVLQFYKGDPVDAQNVWRRWMIAHNVPRPGGTLDAMHLSGCSSHFFGEMVTADEASQFQFIDRYLEERIPIDYWWMDAGWYVNASGWPNTGTWEVDTKRFPRGLRAICDHAHEKGLKTIVWFEPERVTLGTWLYDTHPEWLLGPDGGQKLLDLGNPEARTWLTDHVDALLTAQGIDLYRQDFNMDPLDYWRANDAPDRQGLTENRHIAGYLAYWDELRRRHPDMLIDTCASGGRRNDLETLRRAVPLWRTDYILEPLGTQGCTYGISSWVPYHGTGEKEADAYLFRSMMTPYPNCLWDARRTDLNWDELRRLTGQWKQVAPNFSGDYYPLTPYSLEDTDWIGWQFDRPEAGEGMVQVFRRAKSIYRAADLRLRGLDREARYTVTDLDNPGAAVEMTGAALLDKGLPVEFTSCPGAALYVYDKSK